jgi:hypothetical protein
MMNPQTPQGAHEAPKKCFWDREDDPYAPPDPCPNYAVDEIYWDGQYQPCCPTCMPHAKAARADILAQIDDQILRGAI